MNNPQKGEIYRHFKYDPEGEENNYTYEIIGISIDTETEKEYVVYKPLYKSDFLEEKTVEYFSRPLEIFLEEVEKENYKGHRFIKV